MNMMQHGFNETDELCKKSVELWLTLLAFECGNLATKNLPYGGIYLIGGMITKNSDKIYENKEIFLKGLNSKTKHIKEVIAKIPVFLVKHGGVGLLGVTWFTKRHLGLI